MAFVCNIHFFEEGTAITSASGPGVPNGAVNVSVLADPEDVLKYNIGISSGSIGGGAGVIGGGGADFDYDTEGQLSSTFTGLVPGAYTIAVRSSTHCVKALQVVIPFVYAWQVRHRLQYASVNGGHMTRFDIEDFEYTGDILDAIGDGAPVIPEYEGMSLEDPFVPVVSSKCTVTLLSETDGQYAHLNTHNEIKYRGTLYVHDGSDYVQKWQGFMIPMSGGEPYCFDIAYPVTFIFSDGLADLSIDPFSDDSGNAPLSRMSVMKAIVFCLNKTNLRLNIHETVGIFERTMDNTAADSTLTQLYFDPTVYFDGEVMEDSLTVLQSLLTCIGASLKQSNGVWAVDSPTLKTGAVTPTRKFNSQGSELGNEDIAYRIMLRKNGAVAPKIQFVECDAIKTTAQMYGKLNFVFDYGIEEENNILLAGNFEDQDILNGQLKEWGIEWVSPFPHSSTAEITSIVRDEAKRDVLKFSYTTKQYSTEIAILSATAVPVISRPDNYKIRLSFDVFFTPTEDKEYAYGYVDFSLFIDDPDSGLNYLLPTLVTGTSDRAFAAVTTNLLDGEYNRVYIDDFNGWKTITIDMLIQSIQDLEGDIQLKFRITPVKYFDVVGIGVGGLTSVPTFGAGDSPTRTYNNRIRVFDEDAGGPGMDVIRYYALEASFEATSYPDIIAPIDNLSMRWILKGSTPNNTSDGQQLAWMSSIMMDNVRLQYLPEGVTPPESEELVTILNANIRPELDITFRHGDLPEDENLKNIARGWFSLADGTPTNGWRLRSNPGPGGPPAATLIWLIKDLYAGQYTVDRQKLTGSILHDGVIAWLGNSIYEVRTGKIHTPVMLSFDTKAGTGRIECIETLRGQPVIDEGPAPDPDVEPPVSVADYASVDYDSDDYYTE